MDTKTLVIGHGEVGKGLESVLKKHYVVDIHDPSINKKANGKYEVINICIPWSDEFDDHILGYIKQFDTKLCIIHSTVSPKTTLLDNPQVVFSPIRGKHPDLAKGILEFTKLVGGVDEYAVDFAERFFMNAWIKTYSCNASEAIFAKLLDTTYYGVCIAFAKACRMICSEYDLDYDVVYTHFNESYNEGYKKLGLDHVIRPVLDPPDDQGVGGHCVFQNAELLHEIGMSGFFDSILAIGKRDGNEIQDFRSSGAYERFKFFNKKSND